MIRFRGAVGAVLLAAVAALPAAGHSLADWEKVQDDLLKA
jgi:hypothetical protein